MLQIFGIMAAMAVGAIFLVVLACVCPPIGFPTLVILYLIWDGNRKTRILAEEIDRQKKRQLRK